MLEETALLDEAQRILSNAKERNLALRLMGAVAIRIHCQNQKPIRTAPRSLTDIDIMARGSDYNRIRGFFGDLGYSVPVSLTLSGSSRQIFVKASGLKIDVFYDRLAMCHTIEMSKRFEADYPTVPLAELLMEKMQIVRITEKDIIDAIVLLHAHEIGEDDKDRINGEHIAQLLSRDWGFWYTVTENLKKLRDVFLPRYESLENDRVAVRSRIDDLLARIEKADKSTMWKMRAKIGTSRKWYADVEEVEA